VDSLALAQLLDRADQPFAILDLQGRFLWVNPAFESLTGYSATELKQMSVDEITSETSRATTSQALRRMLREGHSQGYEKEYRRKDGQIVPVVVVADLFRDQTESVCGYFGFVTDISDRVEAENALRASEERFRRLYDEAPFGYHEIDKEGTIQSVNRAECELLGYSRDELIGRPIFDLIAPEDRERARQAVAEKIRGERLLVPFERPYLTRDGRKLIVRIEERYARDDQGRITGLRSTVQDVTAARQTEAALVASERRMRALFEGIEDAVFVHDGEGHILDANPAACRRLGYSRDEFLRLTTRDIDAPDTAVGFTDRLNQQLRTGHLSFEGHHRTRDGRIVPVDINTSTIQLEDRTVILAVVRDITERKALEETRRQFAEAQLRSAQELEATNRELVRSEARARQFTEGCLDAVVAANEHGRITQFNPAASAAFGYRQEEILGQPLDLLLPEEVQAPEVRGHRCAPELPPPLAVGRTVELNGRRQNGEVFPIELALGVIDVGGERQYIASIRDQTERQRMYAVLAQTEKLASIGLLSAGLAHEINNPLAYVSNNLAVLERDLAGILGMLSTYESARDQIAPVVPEVVAKVSQLAEDLDWDYVRQNLKRTITRTREGIQRVTNIVHNLRSLARTAPPQMEQASLIEILESSLDIVQGQLRKANITIDRDWPARLPKIPCAASQIGQVFLNLLVNAIQSIEEAHPDQGGRIWVRIRAGTDRQMIEIADNGRGIRAEHLPRLFDPFFTTKPIGEGTGLGLAFSHGIVSGHGGRIEVDSQPGQGACFRVVLPTQAGRTSASVPPPDSQTSNSLEAEPRTK
jgi:PAS domain S-box-containing protein